MMQRAIRGAMLWAMSLMVGVTLMGCGGSGSAKTTAVPVDPNKTEPAPPATEPPATEPPVPDCGFTLKGANPAAPLARILEADLGASAKAIKVEITDVAKARVQTINFGNKEGKVTLPLVGFRAGAEHKITVTADTCVQPMTWLAPALPSSQAGGEIPAMKVNVATREKMQPGYTYCVIRRRPAMGRTEWYTANQAKMFGTWSTVIFMNEDGEVVWWYQAGRRIGGVTQLKDGTLFMLPDKGGIAQVVDMTGNIISRYYAANRPDGKPDVEGFPIEADEIHHMPRELPNGNLLMMTANQYNISNWFSSEFNESAPRHTPYKIMADNIVEITRKGEVVWNWNAHDYLPHWKIGYESLAPFLSNRGFPGTADWTHGNGVDYDASDNTVLMSFRVQDIFIKVNKTDKSIVWMLGPHDGWTANLTDKLLTPLGDDFAWTYHGHNPHPAETGSGTIMVYNNDIFQHRPFGAKEPPYKSRSRAMEYKIDAANKTVSLVWNSSDPCISWAMGDAHVLPNNNRLVVDAFCQVTAAEMPKPVPQTDLTWELQERAVFTPNDFPMHGRIREYYGASHDVIFEVVIRDPQDLVTYEVFNVGKAADLYGTSASVSSATVDSTKTSFDFLS